MALFCDRCGYHRPQDDVIHPGGRRAQWSAVTFPERSGRTVAFCGDSTATRRAGARDYGSRSPPFAAGVTGHRDGRRRGGAGFDDRGLPLAQLAHQSLAASSGSVPVWISAPFAVVGFVVAWRKPGNPLGWIMLGVAVFSVLSEDASFYTVADYRLRHGGLPLGSVALLAQPGWAPGIVLFGLVVLLFPDGRGGRRPLLPGPWTASTRRLPSPAPKT